MNKPLIFSKIQYNIVKWYGFHTLITNANPISTHYSDFISLQRLWTYKTHDIDRSLKFKIYKKKYTYCMKINIKCNMY